MQSHDRKHSRIALLAILFSLLFGAPRLVSLEASSPKWEKVIQEFEELDRASFPREGSTLFIGSSSIRLWKSLQEDFPDIPVINRGFGGSQVVDLWVFADRIVQPYRPRMIVVYSGGNDIHRGLKPAEVL